MLGPTFQRGRKAAQRIAALPGVDGAATSFGRPGVDGRFEQEVVFVEGADAGDERMLAEVRSVSPSYFATLGVSLLAGELCRNPESGATEAMVNKSFATRYLAQRSPVGVP